MDKTRIINDYLEGKRPMEQTSWELPTDDELRHAEKEYARLLVTPCSELDGCRGRSGAHSHAQPVAVEGVCSRTTPDGSRDDATCHPRPNTTGTGSTE